MRDLSLLWHHSSRKHFLLFVTFWLFWLFLTFVFSSCLSLHDFKPDILKQTSQGNIVLVRSYICCPPAVQRAMEQLSSFVLNICDFSYKHATILNVAAISQQCKRFHAGRYTLIDTSQNKSSHPTFSGAVHLAFPHDQKFVANETH